MLKASEAREAKEATVRERLRRGELGLDIYAMREKLAQQRTHLPPAIARRSDAPMLRGIPCTLMRGGTSKGLYFHARDLPRRCRARPGAAGGHGLAGSRARSMAWAARIR